MKHHIVSPLKNILQITYVMNNKVNGQGSSAPACRRGRGDGDDGCFAW
jgi:hypothetical protein